MKDNKIDFFKQIHNYDCSSTRTYFILQNSLLVDSNNYEFHNNISDCIYVNKKGSNTYPTICVNIKCNGVWEESNKTILRYEDLAKFIYENGDKIICFSGFSRALIGHIIRYIAETYYKNINSYKFKREIDLARYERHLMGKQNRLMQKKKYRKYKLFNF